METFELQKHFFKQLKGKHSSNVSLVDEIADLLSISNDSAYRRIRGEKPVSLEELQKLCKHFRISADNLMNIESNSVVFFGSYADTVNFDFEKYMTDFLMNVKLINSAKSKTIYYDAKDIPLFHYYQIKELTAFKCFFWMRTILSYPEYNKLSFEDFKLPDNLLSIGSDTNKTYNQIPSVEIWTSETLTSALRQIEFYCESGVFKKRETAEMLYNKVRDLILHIKEEAEIGEKFEIGEKPTGNKNNYRLFVNQVQLGHNNVLAETDGTKTAFVNHGVMNYMITRDEKFCDFTKKSIENMMSKSSLISSVSEKERNRFFKILLDKIDRLKEELNRMSF